MTRRTTRPQDPNLRDNEGAPPAGPNDARTLARRARQASVDLGLGLSGSAARKIARPTATPQPEPDGRTGYRDPTGNAAVRNLTRGGRG